MRLPIKNYLVVFTLANLNRISILRVLMKIHRDFQLEEYLIKFNEEFKFNLKHIASGFNFQHVKILL